MKSLLQKRIIIGSILLLAYVQLKSFRLLKTIHVVTDESQNEGNSPSDPSATGGSRNIDASLAIPINSNSTIVEAISKIWLSGPALAILDWQTQKTESGTGTVHCGGYSNKWIDAGDNFLEILILYCEGLERVGNKTAWLKAGFKSKCVEDSMRNRISGDEGTTISIPSSIGGKVSYRLGRWVRRPGIPLRHFFARHQPVECTDSEEGYRPLEPLPEWCEPLTNRDKPSVAHPLERR